VARWACARDGTGLPAGPECRGGGIDLRDQGVPTEPAERRAMRSFWPVPWDPDRWIDTGLPAWVEAMMRDGVRIRPEIEPPPADHPFYRWESGEAQMRAIMEADRHLSACSLEYVPFEEVRSVAATAIVQPWVVARQGVKWRLCHDYSVGLNQYVAASPFILPTPWDVRPCLRPGSRFAEYDIRDGFSRPRAPRQPPSLGGASSRDGTLDVGPSITLRL
jgi:hypothetical protein